VRNNYRLVALIVASALFLENLDATVLATAIPTMARYFQVGAPDMSIALIAYLLALALFIPASGHAADRWGATNVFRAAIAVSSVLQVTMAHAQRATPAFLDFSTAFWTVTGISLCAFFANTRFDPNAGLEMSGARRA
jgi:MFS family permease